MEEFIHQQNVALFKKRLAEPHTDAEREMLEKLLSEEQAKEPLPEPRPFSSSRKCRDVQNLRLGTLSNSDYTPTGRGGITVGGVFR
jgi:hypothetical protein